jgi:hypothetical protein
MKSQCRRVAFITAHFAAAAFLKNQKSPSLSATLLLRDIILMPVICESVFAPQGAEFSLLA